MRKYIWVLLTAGAMMAITGCSSSKEKDRDDWQQFRAKKAQDEMSSDVSKESSK